MLAGGLSAAAGFLKLTRPKLSKQALRNLLFLRGTQHVRAFDVSDDDYVFVGNGKEPPPVTEYSDRIFDVDVPTYEGIKRAGWDLAPWNKGGLNA